MKKLYFLLILTFLFGSLFALTTSTYNHVGATGGYQPTDWNTGSGEKRISLPRYSGTGTLLSAELTLEFHIMQNIGVENTASSGTNINFTGRCISFWKSVPTYSDNTPYFTAETNTGSVAYAAYDGVTDFAGLSGETYSNQSGSIVYSPIVYGGGDLNYFLGNGDFDLNVWTLTGYAVSGGAANVEANVVTTAYAKATIKYIVDETLPVTLSSFSAIQNNGAAQILWRTESENNIQGFYVLKNTVNELSSAQNIAADRMISPRPSRSYSFADADVEKGETYYYWLESVDLSGAVTIYESSSLTITQDVEGTTNTPVNGVNVLSPIYPNPFNPTANIKYELAVGGDVTIEVYNVIGQKVASWNEGHREAGQTYTTAWSGNSDTNEVLSSGVYFFKLSSRGTHQIQKAIMLK